MHCETAKLKLFWYSTLMNSYYKISWVILWMLEIIFQQYVLNCFWDNVGIFWIYFSQKIWIDTKINIDYKVPYIQYNIVPEK